MIHHYPVSEPQRVLQYRGSNAGAPMITETGDHPLLGISSPGTHPKGPPQVNPRRPPPGGGHLSTTPPHHRNLTQGVYPVLFLLSSRSVGHEAFAIIPSSSELSCEWQQRRRYSHRGGFQFSLCLWVLRLSECKSYHQPMKKSNPTAGIRPQTHFGTRKDGHWLRRSSSTL